MRVHYTPKPTAPEQIAKYERSAAPGDLSHYHTLRDWVFLGQPEAARDFERQVAFRVQNRGVKMPVLTLMTDDQGLRACALLAEVIGKVGVKVQVIVGE
jgi:hypothetical protein